MEQTIFKSFKATGISPCDPEVILKRFANTTLEQGSRESSTSVYSGEDWLKMETLIRSTVEDQSKKDAQKLSLSLHHIAVQNELLHHEIDGLRGALSVKERYKKKIKALDLQQRQEYHGGAVFWSPRKVREARVRQSMKEQEEKRKRLQKAKKTEMRRSNKLYKAKIAEEKRVAREEAKREKEKEKAEKAAERAQKKEAHNTEKALQSTQKSKRKTLRLSTQSNKRQKRVVDAIATKEASAAVSAAPPMTTHCGRTVRLPSRYM